MPNPFSTPIEFKWPQRTPNYGLEVPKLNMPDFNIPGPLNIPQNEAEESRIPIPEFKWPSPISRDPIFEIPKIDNSQLKQQLFDMALEHPELGTFKQYMDMNQQDWKSMLDENSPEKMLDNAKKNMKISSDVNPTGTGKKLNSQITSGVASAMNSFGTSLSAASGAYEGEYGALAQGVNSGITTVGNTVGQFVPAVGLAVGVGNAFNGLSNSLFGPLDNMTKTDAIMSSIPGLGGLYSLTGRTSDTFNIDNNVRSQVGSSYSDTYSDMDDAMKKSGKKYGLFSSGALHDANSEILDAKKKQGLLEGVADNATLWNDLGNSMSSVNSLKRKFLMQGAYDQSAVRAGRNGMVLQDLYRAKRITSSLKYYQTGGKIQNTEEDPFEYYLSTLPENQRNSKDFRVRDYWEYNGRPKDFNEAIFRGMFTKEDDGYYHAHSVQENPETGEIEFMKSPNHESIQKEIDWYNSDDASEFRNNYELVKSEPYWKYVKRQTQQYKPYYKEGGSISSVITEISVDNISSEFKDNVIREVTVDSLPIEFKAGGKFNVIPEGALHARKHGMDVKGITKKGIPVVSQEEGGELEQHAEIEREEIIFRLEVTKKLEELSKKYFSEDYKQSEKDQFAIEAGKLLAEEILHNTVDNTNNLL